jgi:molecular chaperone Hsp33
LDGEKMKEHDCLRRFLFEEFAVRGEWVRLQTSWQQTKQHQTLTPALETQLGQALAAVVLLSATIKFAGAMILQAQGDGGLKTLVAQSSHDRKIRGLVRTDDSNCSGSLKQMMGNGRLVLTIESENNQPYQGVVSLEGDCLAQVLETYFRQSEQLQTRLWLFANANEAVGLFLQELPAQADYQADWERIEALASTITATELFDLDCEHVLYRLFHQEKIRLFDSEAVEFRCSCSREKISHTLYAMGQADLEALLAEREVIEVDCEFCAAHYVFNHQEVAALFLQAKCD